MPSRDEVRRLLATGLSCEQVARQLGIHPGVVQLIATGRPASGPPPVQITPAESVLAWIKQRAASDQPMQAAAAARDAAPGEVVDPEGYREIGTVLTRDHDQVTALLEQLSAIPGHQQGGTENQQRSRQSIVDMVTVALSKHEAAEQQYFWPWVQELLGDEPVKTALAQEQAGKDLLVALGRADPDSDEFDELVEKLVQAARTHVAFEDRVLLQLTDVTTEEQRIDIGTKLHRAVRRGPTRPHPHAPVEPAGAVKLAGAPAAVADRVRDVMGSRPAKRRGKAEG